MPKDIMTNCKDNQVSFKGHSLFNFKMLLLHSKYVCFTEEDVDTLPLKFTFSMGMCNMSAKLHAKAHNDQLSGDQVRFKLTLCPFLKRRH